MGLINAIIALCKAVPVLERLFLQISDGIREQKAKSRYEDKLAHIDAAMRIHGLPDKDRVQQREEIDGTSSISESGISRTGFHEKRDEDNR